MTPPYATQDTALGIALGAALFAAVTAPVVLHLVGRTAHRPLRLGPVATAAMACLLGVLAAGTTPGRGPAEVIGVAAVVVLGGAGAVVDIGEGRLPDPLTGALAAAVALAVATGSALDGDPRPALRAAVAAAVIAAGCVVVKLVRSDALGWGDAKLIPVLGAALAAWQPDRMLTAITAAAVAIGVCAGGIGLRDRAAAPSVPYGPALLVGAAAGLAVVG